MRAKSVAVDLLTAIRELLLPHRSDSDGVADVLAGLCRHLDNPESSHLKDPSLPEDRENLLELAVCSITTPELHPVAEKIRLAMRRLTWRIDDGLFYADQADTGQAYRDGNMHAELIGPDGCVFRDSDFRLGLFILGPNTLYRDHRHVAPELYLNLTGPCGWRFNKGTWRDFHAGSLVWNPEGQTHAMKTRQQPFLSVYCWTRNVDSLCHVVAADDWLEIEAQLMNRANHVGSAGDHHAGLADS